MPGIEYSITFVGSIAAAAVLTPIAIRIAKAAGVVDLPNARRAHQSPTPRVGGLAIAAAALVAAVSVLVFGKVFEKPGEVGAVPVITLLAASLFILLVGFADDLVNVPAKFKLLALIAAAVAVCSSGSVISEIGFGGSARLQLGIFAWPVTILWIIGVSVAVNFINGVDGLAAGLVAIAAGVLAVVAIAFGDTVIATLTLALLGALSGFFFYNFNPARVFMGDCGSMFIGFMLASCSVLCTARIGTTAGVLLPALTLAVALIDAVLTFVRRRVLQRRSIFSAERGHIHHRLLDLGLSHRHVAYIILAVSALGGAVGIVGLFGGRRVADRRTLVLWAVAFWAFSALPVRSEYARRFPRSTATGRWQKRRGATTWLLKNRNCVSEMSVTSQGGGTKCARRQRSWISSPSPLPS